MTTPQNDNIGKSVSLGDYLRTLPQYLLPQRLITRITYRLARIQAVWFKNAFIKCFIAGYKVDMSEAAEPNPVAYRHFNAFFTRALRFDARPIIATENALCCPVDGRVSQVGKIHQDSVLQAKGRSFSLLQLVGGDPAHARLFENGEFATLYLAPRDYHRIHMPLRGVLREMVHIPGRLFSVSPLTTRVVPALFARNERVVVRFDTVLGPMTLILVGAINVASIETVWAGLITPPLGSSIQRWHYPEQGADSIVLEKGAELGRFNMGSTVIVLCPLDAVRWDSAIRAGAVTRMGAKLADIVAG